MKPFTDPTHGAQTLLHALNFKEAADRLVASYRDAPDTHRMQRPVHFLLQHAAELTLKAVLHGYRVTSFGRDKHSLPGLLRRCRSHGFEPTEDFARLVAITGNQPLHEVFRYGSDRGYTFWAAEPALAAINGQMAVLFAVLQPPTYTQS